MISPDRPRTLAVLMTWLFELPLGLSGIGIGLTLGLTVESATKWAAHPEFRRELCANLPRYQVSSCQLSSGNVLQQNRPCVWF